MDGCVMSTMRSLNEMRWNALECALSFRRFSLCTFVKTIMGRRTKSRTMNAYRKDGPAACAPTTPSDPDSLGLRRLVGWVKIGNRSSMIAAQRPSKIAKDVR